MSARTGRPLGLRRGIWILALVSLVLMSVTPPLHAQSLEKAREERAALQIRLDQAAEAVAEIETRSAILSDELDALVRRIEGLERDRDAAQARVALRVRDVYKNGAVDPVLAFVGGTGPTGALARANMARQLVARDNAAAESAHHLSVALQDSRIVLAEREAELAAAQQERAAIFERLNADLEAAAAVERRLEQELARRLAAERAAASAAVQVQKAARQENIRAAGGFACPVAQPRSFFNDWGNARSGGRSHKGTDIMAPRGTHVYAIVGGTLDIRRPGRSAGLWAILRGVDGNSYWYLHLDGWAVGDGASVRAGQLIGFNGDTGNARGTTPHVHFEYHPGGGGASNPYHLVKKICG